MLTQDDYKLWTGEAVNFSDEDWQKIVSMSAVRLAGFLCLEELPTDADGDLSEELKLILSNFICLMLAGRGRNLQVASKKVRNFTINYNSSNATNAFAKLNDTYGDIIAKYSNCRTGFRAEKSTRCEDGCF